MIPRPSGRAQDPRSALLLSDQPTAAAVLDVAFALTGAAALLLVLRELVLGWRAAGRAQRQGLARVLWTGAVVLGALALTVALRSVGVTDAASTAAIWIASGAVLVLPYALLRSAGPSLAGPSATRPGRLGRTVGG